MKNNLLAFTITIAFLKVLFLPQFASAQNSRQWATYYGGNGDDFNHGVATDRSANVYLAGETGSSNNIGSGGFQNTKAGNYDAFLVKFDASGNRIWGTYYGGKDQEYGYAVATDGAGNVYLAGTTLSDSGIASGGFQNTIGNAINGSAFLVKFDANGNRLWATYYGGTIYTSGGGVATDVAGNVYLAGSTDDTAGIASGGFQNIARGTDLAFLVKFDANGNRLWATYYGGMDAGTSSAAEAVTTDFSGNVYLTGYSHDTTGIAYGGFQNTSGGGDGDAFLVKFDTDGNRIWATYYGGSGTDIGSCLATDTAGNVYMGGSTNSTDSIALGGFLNTYPGGYFDAYLAKFDANGNRLWATYYGGPSQALGEGVATDVTGNVWLAGVTTDSSGIASGGFENNYLSQTSAYEPFLVKFDANGIRQCATYYGAIYDKSSTDASVVTDTAGNVYLGSYTFDLFNISSGGFQNTCGGIYDADLVKFCPCTNCRNIVLNFEANDTTFCGKECINYTDLSLNTIVIQWSFPGGSPSSSQDQNPQNICYDSAGSYDVKLIVHDDRGNLDSITFISFINSLAPPPTPVITQHHDTLFCTTDPSYTAYQWYDSTTLIPGATDTFLIVTHGGNYNVAVHNEFGCAISVGITIAHDVGINEFSTNNFISLSPNPASDQLLIHTSSSRIAGKAIISIINVLGEIIQEEKLKWTDDIIINIKTIPPGIYFLQMKTERGIDTKRFVKE